MKRVFLSSTVQDLQDYRAAAYGALTGLDGYHCVRMEDFGARDGQTEAFCREKVQECNLFIGIVGHLYGSCPPDSALSFTEIEYEAAIGSAPPVPCLMFMTPADLPYIGREDDVLHKKQRAFRARVRERIRAEFRTPSDLEVQILTAIRNWETTTRRTAVEEGLGALGDMMADPQVKVAVALYGSAFRIACERIDSLAAYKDIHDQLHKLQFLCFDMILHERPRFPEPQSVENLQLHEITLGEVISELRRIANGIPPQAKVITWIEDLAKAHLDLHDALVSQSADPLSRAVNRLSRVLCFRASEVNSLLNVEARAIDFDGLLANLYVLKGRLRDLNVDPSKLGSFATGVETLNELKGRLQTLVAQHDDLQVLENEVRRIENTRSLKEELDLSWGHTLAVGPLVTDQDEALHRDTQRLGDIVQGTDPGDIVSAFRLFRRRVGTLFHRVDSDLKARCEDLRSFGHSLASILESLR